MRIQKTIKTPNGRAQIQSQLFVYIMILVVGAGILVFGYNAIQGFRESADDVLFLKFETRMKNDLKSIAYQAEQVKTYDLPVSVDQVCFKSKDAVPAQAAAYIAEEESRQSVLKRSHEYPIIQSSIAQGADVDVFMYPNGQRAFFSGVSIDLPERPEVSGAVGFMCFDVRGGILKIKLTGQGKSVLVSTQ